MQIDPLIQLFFRPHCTFKEYIQAENHGAYHNSLKSASLV